MANAWIELHHAFVRGDLEEIRRRIGPAVPAFPNGPGPSLAVGRIVLQYAIYHSPLAMIAELLAAGADANYPDHAGFPALITALSTNRPERRDILILLLAGGADPNQRGVNDLTPLHYAAGRDDIQAMQLLLDHGADRDARARVDDFETALDVAQRAAARKAIALLQSLAEEPVARERR